jgi:hypothetical protein
MSIFDANSRCDGDSMWDSGDQERHMPGRADDSDSMPSRCGDGNDRHGGDGIFSWLGDQTRPSPWRPDGGTTSMPPRPGYTTVTPPRPGYTPMPPRPGTGDRHGGDGPFSWLTGDDTRSDDWTTTGLAGIAEAAGEAAATASDPWHMNDWTDGWVDVVDAGGGGV